MAAGELDNQVSVALTVRAKAEGVTKILAIYRMEDIETIKAAYEASLNEKVEFLRVRTAPFPPACCCLPSVSVGSHRFGWSLSVLAAGVRSGAS